MNNNYKIKECEYFSNRPYAIKAREKANIVFGKLKLYEYGNY